MLGNAGAGLQTMQHACMVSSWGQPHGLALAPLLVASWAVSAAPQCHHAGARTALAARAAMVSAGGASGW
jgi:hypothetical protein